MNVVSSNFEVVPPFLLMHIYYAYGYLKNKFSSKIELLLKKNKIVSKISKDWLITNIRRTFENIHINVCCRCAQAQVACAGR